MCVSSVGTVTVGVSEDPGTLYTGGRLASEGSADLRLLAGWLTRISFPLPLSANKL